MMRDFLKDASFASVARRNIGRWSGLSIKNGDSEEV